MHAFNYYFMRPGECHASETLDTTGKCDEIILVLSLLAVLVQRYKH
jgi:hypothetical protein